MIHAIVLAAGRSQRMGTQKLLLPIAGQPVMARIVDELQQSPLPKSFVVIGCDGKKVQQALAGRSVPFISNPDPAGDMLGSVRCGLRPSRLGAGRRWSCWVTNRTSRLDLSRRLSPDSKNPDEA